MIEAIGLTKVYGKTVAVDDLSFSVRPGAVTGFLGPNGSGKSTTMRMVLGLDNPTKGRALIGGQPYAALKRPLTKVGSLLDANWIHPNRSARSHLKFMASSNGISVRRVDEVLDIVGLATVAKKAAGKFSLGMKQRLGIAGALLGDPEVLLFDEPVNGLDPEGIHWIRTFMKNLAGQGRTVFVSSHLLSEMSLTADHLIVIGRGRMIADASTEEFISRATESSVRVRSPQLGELRHALLQRGLAVTDAGQALVIKGAPIEQIGDVAGEAGVVLHELSAQAGSLEDAFIQLTGDSVEYGATDLSGGYGPGPGQGAGYPPVSGYPAAQGGFGPGPAGFAPAGIGPGGPGGAGSGVGAAGPPAANGPGYGAYPSGGYQAGGYPPPGYPPPGYGPPSGAGLPAHAGSGPSDPAASTAPSAPSASPSSPAPSSSSRTTRTEGE